MVHLIVTNMDDVNNKEEDEVIPTEVEVDAIDEEDSAVETEHD